MSAEILDRLKRQIAALPTPEKQQLTAFLTEQLQQSTVPQVTLHTERSSPIASTDEEEMRLRRMEWLKAHREEYGGQYVVLDCADGVGDANGVSLISRGRSYREAHEMAKGAGHPDAFITYLPKPDEVAEWEGWS